MSKIKWLHLSDLHFGSEEIIPDIANIRENLFVFLDTIRDNKFKYLFISGDIFYAPVFYKKQNGEKEEIIDNAILFILKLIHKLNIKRKDVFIVPGNHDTARNIAKPDASETISKETYIDSIKNTYQDTEILDIEELKKFQKYFNQLCEKINNVYYDNETLKIKQQENSGSINYCDAGHKLIEKSDIDVLMLNSSLSSCKKNEDMQLLLGAKLFRDEINKIKDNHWENESFPLFVLSHHYSECFRDKEALKTKLKNKKDMVLYLCGHDHYAKTIDLDNINTLVCGTYVKKEIENNFKLNEVNFLTGLFDTTLLETTVFFYKWDYRNETWMENRDISATVPHNSKIITENNPKKNVLSSRSESEAVNNFFTYLLETLEAETKNKNKDYQCTYFKDRMNEMLTLIEDKKPAWKFHSKFKAKFNIEINDIENLLEIIREEYTNYTNVKQLINSKVNILTEKIDKKRKEKAELREIGILLYSKSTRVTDYLLNLPPKYKKDIVVYICSGDIRSNNILYQDGLDIASELFENRTRRFNDLKNVQLIPDIYADRLMKEGKIQFVLMGVHSLYFGIKNYTHFNNTTGSNLIIDLSIKYKVECLIIADISKAYNIYPYSQIHENLETIKSFLYPTDITKFINAEFNPSELVDIEEIKKSNLITIITDVDENPWDNIQELTPATIEKFNKKILKDRRKLVFNDKQNTIEKYFLLEDKKIESNILKVLLANNINVPEIKGEREDCIILNYYKGIRVFNLIVSIDNLKNKYEKSSSEYNKLDQIAKKLLSRCEVSQKKIQIEIYNNLKNSSEISKYPKDKLTDIIDLLFLCINFDKDLKRKEINKEMDIVYSHFEKYAIVPFRDASTKNMILENNDLYLNKFQNENDRNNYLQRLFTDNKLESMIDSSNIIDIDFSSCINTTTPYDDVISFRCHERTEPYFSFETIEAWNKELVSEERINTDMLVATFIIRFLRFGGRKLLYRIIAPDLQNVRFKHDTEIYYFKKLQEIIRHYNITYLPETTKLFNKIEEILTSGNRNNFFIIPYDDKSISEKTRETRKKETYLDIFPY